MLSPYLTWVLIFFIVPTLVVWVFFWKHLIKYKWVIAFAALISTVVGIGWDVYAVKVNIWSWPEECCTLPRLPYNIASEEIIWAIAVAVYVCTVLLISREIFKTHRKLKSK